MDSLDLKASILLILANAGILAAVLGIMSRVIKDESGKMLSWENEFVQQRKRKE